MPADVARRAYDLFTGLRATLGDELNLTFSSKTELALPDHEGKPWSARGPSLRLAI